MTLLWYAGCTPDFDKLNRGMDADSGGTNSNGGSQQGGQTPERGGSEAGGLTNSGGNGAGSGGTSPGGGCAGSACPVAGSGAAASAAGGGAGAAGETSIGGLGGQAPVETGGTGGGSIGSGGQGGVPVAEQPIIRHDFESNLEDWGSVYMPIPLDCLDSITQSTGAAHHGSGALAMTFDGEATATSPDVAFYGAARDGAPPASAEVKLWLMSTAPGVTVEVFAQLVPDWTWVPLSGGSDTGLTAGVWKEISVSMPETDSMRFGVKLYSALDIEGVVYLDDIRW